jgi:hypothetical protein
MGRRRSPFFLKTNEDPWHSSRPKQIQIFPVVKTRPAKMAKFQHSDNPVRTKPLETYETLLSGADQSESPQVYDLSLLY